MSDEKRTSLCAECVYGIVISGLERIPARQEEKSLTKLRRATRSYCRWLRSRPVVAGQDLGIKDQEEIEDEPGNAVKVLDYVEECGAFTPAEEPQGAKRRILDPELGE